MALQDLTTYTEVDPNSRYVQTTTKNTATGLQKDEDAFVYKDFGAGFFNANFSHEYQGEVTGGSNGGFFYGWMLANVIDDWVDIDLASGDGLAHLFYNGAGKNYFYIYELDGGTQYQDFTAALANVGTQVYYFRTVRDESVGTYGTIYIYIFSDAARTTLVDILTIALHSSKKNYRYQYVGNSQNNGTTIDINAYVENVDLTEVLVERYFVGDTDSDWNDASNWAAYSGGPGGAGVPGVDDIALFDANSPSCTVDAAFSPSVGKLDLQTGFAATLDINDRPIAVGSAGFSMAAGTLNAGTGVFTVTGDCVKTGGTFTHENGTFEMNGGGGSRILNFPSGDFYKLNIDIGGGWTLTVTNTAVVTNTLTLAVGSSFKAKGTGKIQFQGDVIAGGAIRTDSQIQIEATGSGTQDIYVDKAGGSGDIPGLAFAHSGTVNLFDDISILGSGGFTYTSGTVVAGTSTINLLGSGSVAISISSITLYNFNIDNNGWTTTVTGDINVSNDVTITSSNTTNGAGALKIGGSFTCNDAALAGTFGIELNGTGTQSIAVGANDLFNGNFTINKATGDAVLTSAFTPASWTGDLNVVQGTFTLAGFDLTVDNDFDVDDTLKLKGNETITVGLMDLDTATSTVWFYDAAVAAIVTDYFKTYFNFKTSADKTHKFGTGAGNKTTVNGALQTTGTVTNPAIYESVTPTTQWQLDYQGSVDLDDKVDVTDSDASFGNMVQAIGSVNGGNNDNWFFVVLPPSDVKGATVGSLIVGRPGPKTRQAVQGVQEWT